MRPQEQDDILALRLSEQELLRQSLEEKANKIEELEQEVKYLRNTLNSALAAPRYAPAPAPAPVTPGASPRRTGEPVPQRWRIR